MTQVQTEYTTIRKDLLQSMKDFVEYCRKQDLQIEEVQQTIEFSAFELWDKISGLEI